MIELSQIDIIFQLLKVGMNVNSNSEGILLSTSDLNAMNSHIKVQAAAQAHGAGLKKLRPDQREPSNCPHGSGSAGRLSSRAGSGRVRESLHIASCG